MKLFQLFKKNALIVCASLVLMMVAVNTLIIVYNNRVIKETAEVRKQTEQVKADLASLWGDVVRGVDVSVRGFSVDRNEKFLEPFKTATDTYTNLKKELERILNDQKFSEKEALIELFTGIDAFIAVETEMIGLLKDDQRDAFIAKFNEDHGMAVWAIHDKNSKIILGFQDELNNEAIQKSELVGNVAIIFQILLVIISMPTLIFMILTISNDKRKRNRLFLELEKNNREYLFNPGTTLEVKDENEVIQNSIKNFKKAATLISEISSGNYDIEWNELNEKNKELNKTNLAGELVQMKAKMMKLKNEDERRNWSTQGLANFSEVIRNHQHNLNQLCYEVLVFLTKYLNAQQGAFFLLQEEGDDTFLEMTACYAFDKKKHVTKRVEIGQGLIGQTYKEKQPAMLTEIPQGYTSITSGLGDTTPGCLLVVPLLYNEKAEGVIELAGFEKFESHQVEFMNKVGDIIASTLGAVKTSEKTKVLLEQFQVQTEQLKAQEEELRQNMEEMQATQEALRREAR